jgi:type VI secretion system protein ImpL
VLKYIFATIFIALAWALALVFRESVPLWTAVVVTVVIAGGLLALAVYRLLAARRAASAIEKGLGAQAQQQNAGLRPDLQAEIAAMQAEFQKAVQSLKSSKLGRSGRDALGLLPWYVIIGPPGAGKTTAIRSSGLKFPSGKGGVVRGVGGTRNCDWWMTNEAILLDTAGRWSTEDDDRDEWLAFLDLLKSTRPKKPVNGILLAISATELQKGEDEIATLAQGLRERIDEVITRLDMVVPVYLLVTKCDLLSGFVEIFGDLKDRDRGQIWGFSLPLVSEHSDHVDAFAQHFDDLSETAERFSILRMGEERRVEARERIYAFPQQFDSLRQGLIDLVANLFDQSVYQDGPIMRGVYFSSGTQEGRPVDRVMASMAEAFGVRPRVGSAPSTKPKSYFVRDLFQKVVFPDRDVAVSSTRVLRRQRLLRWGSAGGALAASIAFLVLPISSYVENKQFVVDARGFVERLAHARAEHDNAGPLAPAALEAADPMATRLATFASKGPDVSLRFGLYPGARLMDPLHLAVERLVVRPILDADADRLMAFTRGRGDLDASGAVGGLMLHLLLTQPKAPDEPAPESDGWSERWATKAAQQMSERWGSIAGETATARAKHAVEGSVRFYTLGVEASRELIERKSNVVSRTRTALLGATDGDPLADLLRDPSLPRDVRLIDVVGGAITVFQNGGDQRSAGPSVPGAFTPAGWKIVKARIERLTSDSKDDETAWVLGAARKRNTADAATLQAAYFRRYVDAWKTFLLSLSVKEPTNIADVRSLLGQLVREKPLDAIWRNAGKELQFKDDSLLSGALNKGKSGLGDRIDQVRKKLGVGGDDNAGASGQGRARGATEDPTSPDDVGNQFAAFLNFGLTKPTGVEAYGQVLAELSAAVGEAGTPDPKTFQATVKAQRVKLSNLIANYNDAGWEGPLLEKLLMPPLRGAEVAVSGATGDSANRKWCDGIVVAYDQLLAGKYPFTNAKGAREARVADVDKFFQPKTGTLWQYFADTLLAEIDHPTGTTVFHLKDQPSVKYKSNLTDFLKRAQELTDLLYAKDPTKIGVAAAIRIRSSAPYSKIVFESGGRKITYFNSKERWDDVTWPGRGALFRFFLKSGEGELGYTDGEWALFHLLEDGKLTTQSDGEEYLAGIWTPPLGDGSVRADVKPAGLFRAFRKLEVPRSIVSGSGGCGR